MQSRKSHKLAGACSGLVLLLLPTLSILAAPGDTLRARRVVLSTSLLEYMPSLVLNSHNINLGTEFNLKGGYSLYTNLGLVQSKGPSDAFINIASEGSTGFKIQLEGKSYFNRYRVCEPAMLLFWPHILQYGTVKNENTGYYVALNSSYELTNTKRKETVVDYIDNKPFPNSVHYKENSYSVDRSVYKLNLKFGYQCIKKCGFTVDYSVGLGGQYISSVSNNRLGDDTGWSNSQGEFPWGKPFDDGAGFYPNFIYQLRLGWRL